MINLPFPAPGVLVHELPEKALSNGTELSVPLVTVTEPKLRLYVACVHSLFTLTTALAPLITSELTVTFVAAVRFTLVFAPTVKVLMDEVRLISTGVMPDTERLFEPSTSTLCGMNTRPSPPGIPPVDPPAAEMVPPEFVYVPVILSTIVPPEPEALYVPPPPPLAEI
jgi:hypothetical protein